MGNETPPDEEDDENLLISIALYQDRGAVTTLVNRYGSKLKGYLTKHYGDSLREPEIQQAVNRAFFNVWRFAERFDPKKGKFKGWLLRIAQNAAVSIIRAEDKHQAKSLEHEPSYDPADPCEEATPECGLKERQRAEILRDIIDNELKGLEQAIARADLEAGKPADAARLAALHGTSKNVIYSTRSQLKVKIKKRILEREAQGARPKGKS